MCHTPRGRAERVGSVYNDPKREAAGKKQWGEQTVDVAWALQKWLKCVGPILGEGCNTGEIKEEEGKKKRVKRKAVSRLFLIPPLHVAKDDSAVWKGGMSTKWIVSQAKIQPVSFLNHTSGRLRFYFLLFLLSCFFQKLEIRFEQVCGFMAQPFIPVYRQAGWEQTAARVHVRDGTERER